MGLRRHGQDRVERAGEEVRELDLDNRPLAHPGGADRRADEPLLGDRRVDHPVVAELLLQARGHPERAAEVTDVLAQQEHAVVVAERVGERRPNGLQVRDLRHHADPTRLRRA